MKFVASFAYNRFQGYSPKARGIEPVISSSLKGNRKLKFAEDVMLF
jgi:hypothetical protein